MAAHVSRQATGFVCFLVIVSSLSAQLASAAGRGLSDTGDSEGRLLKSTCIESDSSLQCQGYPYPACCSSSGNCIVFQSSVTCTNPSYAYPGCCSSLPGKSKCFPAAAQVETPHGKKAMSSVQVGDKVLSVDSTGHLRFETVYMFSHHDSDAAAQFVALRTSANATVRLTPGHYIWATPAAAAPSPDVQFAGSAAVRKPEDLSPGDFVWMRTPSGDQVQPVQVTEVAHEYGTGLFNPHVLGGTIVVDDVAALAFPSTLFPSVVAHRALILPVRLLYALFPSDGLAMRVNLALLQMMGKAN
eukprot:TRINITY_DN11833_c0_g1_i1.p1 TRINITY_DN11833_c0_g1~~TRINITY_DN11833_c0_g1_i1.p1  ORF type:complete len:300 (+),score=58.63 TRINITY_DN11833_c0_g1_i1:251-1150(+)